jgi:hypothetical protein
MAAAAHARARRPARTPMMPLPLLLLPAAALGAAGSPLLGVAVDEADGSFHVSMGGAPWLASAAPRFFSGGAWANLTLLGTAPAPPLTGFRSGKSWRWSTTGAGGVAVWETAIRLGVAGGADAALFSQTFLEVASPRGFQAPLCPNVTSHEAHVPPGCTTPVRAGSRVSADEFPMAEFPSVEVAKGGPALGTFCGAGMSDGPRIGLFNSPDYDPASTTNVPGNWGGSAGGPTVRDRQKWFAEISFCFVEMLMFVLGSV